MRENVLSQLLPGSRRHCRFRRSRLERPPKPEEQFRWRPLPAGSLNAAEKSRNALFARKTSDEKTKFASRRNFFRLASESVRDGPGYGSPAHPADNGIIFLQTALGAMRGAERSIKERTK